MQASRPESAFPQTAPTSEASWLTLGGGLPELMVSPLAVTVAAPHPDDETLACGGLIADLAAAGVEVNVVAVTDGDGSHPGRPGLAERRRDEQDRALATLGVAAPVHRLHLADGEVEASVDQLTDVLAQCGGQGHLLVAPWERDGHCDHDACGAAARRAADRTGARLLQYPVWAWQWARPSDFADVLLRRRTLSDRAAQLKRKAISSFRSQTTDQEGEVILSPVMVERFHRPWEVFVDG